MRVRTIVTQDAEIDDRNSLRHFLFYANEVDLEGIVQTSSKFHWLGVPGCDKEYVAMEGDFPGEEPGEYDKPYRWPGYAWMWEVLDDYEKDYPYLNEQAEGYPTPDYLRSITKVGNIGYKGEMDAPSEGSELIRKAILKEDERPLYIQIWGGCNTIARALLDIENEYRDKPEWEALHRRISEKVVLTACGEQDETYRTYIAEVWPDMLFVKTLQMMSYAYPWYVMPESESKDCLRGSFMEEELLSSKSALVSQYATWMDGQVYPGEGPDAQFGSNPNIVNEWFGATLLPEKPQKYDFLSEGDSPTFIPLLNWGFRTLEDFSYGGMAGRYHRVEGEVNSKGERLNMWDVSKDRFTGRDGNTVEIESMWPHVAEIQRDFAARAAWADPERKKEAEHAPSLQVAEGVDGAALPGEDLVFHVSAMSRDPYEVNLTACVYEDASSEHAKDAEIELCTDKSADISAEEDQSPDVKAKAMLRVSVPASCAKGDVIHVLVKAESQGHYRLVQYRQIIVTVQ